MISLVEDMPRYLFGAFPVRLQTSSGSRSVVDGAYTKRKDRGKAQSVR
jgi:hypothetical protein